MAGILASAVLAAASAVAGGEEVTAREEGGRVVLSNEYVAVVVEPNGGMYVPEATDLATGKRILKGLKLNFPYFEHGIKDSQTAGYRIVRNPDGGITVAMNMRFCHHQGPKEIERYGRFALAGRALSVDEANEHAFHVKGLIALEQGKPDEAGGLLARAGVQAHCVRALMSVTKGDVKEAIGLLDTMVKARPSVYRPRLLLVYLQAKMGRAAEMSGPARALVDENPAYPEAAEVLSRVAALAGDRQTSAQAGEARDALLRNNPDAERQLALFRAELDKGHWVYIARCRDDLPQP